MKTTKWVALLSAGLLVVLLASCGPSYVGVRTAPNYGYGYGPGYYGARPYYGYNYGPYGYYRRPPVIVQQRTYVTPRYRNYNNGPSYTPNGRSGRYNNGGYRSNGSASNGRSRGPR